MTSLPNEDIRQGGPVSGAMTPKGFRLDIQGVRGFALVLVLCCHAQLPFAEGGFVGLDVFYVLSGFLITGLVLGEIERTGRLSLLGFYARRAKRLLPLAATVLAVVAVGALALFGPVRGYAVARDVVASALYFVNWRFIARSVDYFAFDDAGISPVQHFWSLSVEEQFYLLWPALLLVVAWLAHRAGARPRRALWLVLVPLTGASLVYGAHLSELRPHAAYFSSLARGWELALGGVLALALPAGMRLPRAVSAALAGGGLAVLTWMTVTFSDQTPYPGWWALAPTLATVAIIVAGTATVAPAPVRLLTLRPLQYLGRISYAWYLWHWPALVFAAAIWGPLSLAGDVAVTLASWVPTIVTHHLVEERFRRSRPLARAPRRGLALGLGCTVAAVAAGGVLDLAQTTVPTARASEVEGAATVDRGDPIQTSAKAVRPSPRHANDDRGPTSADGCHQDPSRPVEHVSCVYGDPRSTTTVVLLGDSHGLMYAPALLALAKRHDWRFVSLTRGGCTSAEVHFQDRCDAWRERSLERIEREDPDLVVVTNAVDFHYRVERHGQRLSRHDSEPVLEAGFARTLRRIRRTGAKVAVIRDVAKAPLDVPDCVAGHLDHLRACAFRPDRRGGLAFDVRGAARVRHVKVIDPLPEICPHHLCPAVIGNALVYRNSYHLSATFSRTLAPWLRRQLPRPRHVP